MTSWTRRLSLHLKLEGGYVYVWKIHRDGEDTGAVMTTTKAASEVVTTLEYEGEELDLIKNPKFIQWLEERIPKEADDGRPTNLPDVPPRP